MSEDAMKYEVGGNHYKRMVIQPIEFILKNNLGFCEGNVIKYITRYRHKNGKEDLLKARHYIDLLIESECGAIWIIILYLNNTFIFSCLL